MKSRWVFLTAFALVFYSTGAAFVESFVNYPSWRLIGASEFVAYHRFITPRVVAFLVAPAMLGTVFTVLLLWFRPRAIPRAAVWLAILCNIVVWTATFLIHIPIQMRLSASGLSLPLIDQLVLTNFWLRRVPYLVCAALFLWMAARVLRACDDGRSA